MPYANLLKSLGTRSPSHACIPHLHRTRCCLHLRHSHYGHGEQSWSHLAPELDTEEIRRTRKAIEQICNSMFFHVSLPRRFDANVVNNDSRLCGIEASSTPSYSIAFTPPGSAIQLSSFAAPEDLDRTATTALDLLGAEIMLSVCKDEATFSLQKDDECG